MMTWEKIAFVDNVVPQIGWSKSHAQVPTLLLKEDRLRVYFATRPQQDQTLTTFCDLSLDDLSKVICVHDKPILELGTPGTFDQHGIMPSAVVEKDGLVYLYYSGWCRATGVPYNNFTGLAISEDGGMTFKKKFYGPIIDRTPHELYSATSPEVFVDDKWHMFYCSGTNWHNIDGKLEHTYDIKYACSEDGLSWDQTGRVIVDQVNEYEAITKPAVIRFDGSYHMWYCFRGSKDFRAGNEAYRIGYASSDDLLEWQRKDELAGISV
ncbi:MAG: hypothetical protein K0R82_2149, partial [Flavipsychrobacter sp.]|nr:hypothetical protein [Flavipsychrobacter sp.]